VLPDAVDAISSTDPSTVGLATTLRRRLAASVEVRVVQNNSLEQPFRIGVWSPWTTSGYFVVFGPSPERAISTATITDGQPGATLNGGKVSSTPLAHYDLGGTYKIEIVIERDIGTINARVLGRGVDAAASLNRSVSPALFGNVQLSLTASTGSGTNEIVLRNFSLRLPHERSWASKIDDPVAKALAIILASVGLITIAIAVVPRWRRPDPFKWRIRLSGVTVVAAVLYIAGNAALFPLGGHPFDFANESLYAYVARVYGPVQLYFLPDVTASHSNNWSGVPWIEAAFPYEPVIAYLFSGIGWISSILFAGGGVIARSSDPVGNVIKSVNVAFGLADGLMIYVLLRELNLTARSSKIGAALFLFNPAVWFSMSVWGQTHVVSIFFILATVLFTQRNMAMWAWLALVAALLTRPQMAVFGVLLGVVLLKKFPLSTNVAAVSWTVIVAFVVLTPLTLATSPSLPIDVLVHNISVQEAGGNQDSLTTVSQSAYSVWPLVTYALQGASGMERAFTPSSGLLIGSLTYQRASQILTVIAIVIVALALAKRKRSAIDSGGYLPLVAVGVAGFLLLLTGVVATHFLLALPLLLICRPWMSPIPYCYVIVAWSLSTLVPMYGDMGAGLSSYAYPLLAPDRNPVTHFFVALYVWDRFITVAIVANICAIIWLAFLATKPPASSRLVAKPEPL